MAHDIVFTFFIFLSASQNTLFYKVQEIVKYVWTKKFSVTDFINNLLLQNIVSHEQWLLLYMLLVGWDNQQVLKMDALT